MTRIGRRSDLALSQQNPGLPKLGRLRFTFDHHIRTTYSASVIRNYSRGEKEEGRCRQARGLALVTSCCLRKRRRGVFMHLPGLKASYMKF